MIGQEHKWSLHCNILWLSLFVTGVRKAFRKTVLLGREEGKSEAALPDEVLRNKREILLKVFKRGSPMGLHGAYSMAPPGNRRSRIHAWHPIERRKFTNCLVFSGVPLHTWRSSTKKENPVMVKNMGSGAWSSSSVVPPGSVIPSLLLTNRTNSLVSSSYVGGQFSMGLSHVLWQIFPGLTFQGNKASKQSWKIKISSLCG